MISSKNVANAVGGKTARACDSCIKKRARWYCAADDAFLCQACDASVHSANPLARRHERVRLKTASLKSSTADHQPLSDNSVPSWHRGFAKKARTPRQGKSFSNYPEKKNGKSMRNMLPLVPEVGADEISHEENEEDQLLYRVPIYDPFLAELCTSVNSNEAEKTGINDAPETADIVNESESKAVLLSSGYNHKGDVDSLHGLILPSDMNLAEFAADVETLLGRGLENESFAMEDLGLVDYRETGKVKVEEEEEEEGVQTAARDIEDDESCKVEYNDQIDMEREPFEFNFDCDSPATCGVEDEKVIKEEMAMEINDEDDQQDDDGEKKMKKKRKILLRLDYEAVITAWASQGSPWTTGDRPDFDPSECWPQCMGTCGNDGLHQYPPHPYGDYAGIGSHPAMVDGGREARVSRYREKRRTRLFSKKIRYEVRKLNAEKRPRMKGRFVKRASLVVPPPKLPLFNK